jgi:hypothetical protein
MYINLNRIERSPDSNVIQISGLPSHIRKQEKEEMQPLNIQYSNIESNPRRCGINLKAQYGCEQTLKSSINGEFGRPEMMKET